MKFSTQPLFAIFAGVIIVLLLTLSPMNASYMASYMGSAKLAGAEVREDAYRANNLGVALLEQFKNKDAVESFTRALKSDPHLAIAQINLSIALYNLPDVDRARQEAERAIEMDPNAPQPHYILGLIARSQGRGEEALPHFQQVLSFDPEDVGANVNIGQVYAQQQKYPQAIAAFRIAFAAEPYNSTAVYNLATALIRSGDKAEGQRMIQRFQELRQSGAGSVIGQTYLEQGRYAEAVASTGVEPGLVDRGTPAVTFADVSSPIPPSAKRISSAPVLTGAPSAIGRHFNAKEINGAGGREAIASALGGSVTLLDYDGDGDLDLFIVSAKERHLYRNDDGKFADVTSGAGSLASGRGGIAAVAGDYDNDGKVDLFLVSESGCSLFHNDGNGKFSDVTTAAGIPSYRYLSSSVAFVDVDHDGDLDIFVGGLADLSKLPTGRDTFDFPGDFAGAPNMLLRNDGNGKFTDVTVEAKVDGAGHAVAVVPTDYNNSRDVDLLVVNYGAPPKLFSNLRDRTFRNVANDVGLKLDGNWTCVAAGDLNKDGFTDLFFGRADGPGLFAVSDGKGKFKTQPVPQGSEGANAAQFLDYDNDGLLDCVLLTREGLRVWRNVGDSWIDTTQRAVGQGLLSRGSANLLHLATADLDKDGDTDLVALSSTGELRLARNDGGNKNNSIRIDLSGRISNRSGIGVKIESRSGSLLQKFETSSAYPAPVPADVVFGLGKRDAPDAVRILWPAGIVQAETEFPSARTASARAGDPKTDLGHVINMPVTELDRKPSSCPFLYTWNGERFEFVTDFMGGGEMGYLEEPGRYNSPDPDEYVRIRDDQLKERNGRYEIRVTNELEEALFVDRMQLISVAHPSDIEVYPNEGMIDPPLPPFKLYTTKGARPPLTASDDHGNDVLQLITKVDRRYPADFQIDKIRGYSDEHSLTLKLDNDQATNSGHMLLLLTGWTDYAWSSDNLAASQAGKAMTTPALQVRDAKGKWRTVIENIGIPVGRPQTVTVDLTGKFLSRNREVRIVTNMRIYWDQILVDSFGGDSPVQMTKLDPISANLHWRGYSREISPDGHEPYGYDYRSVSFTSPWKVMTGHYTREGDVRELVQRTDDMFVIARTGDEISLAFDARALPPLPAGWKRTFLLYADGFSKEMDVNSASPDQLAPLPFHGMKRYPYSAPDAYPLTPARLDYLERYNTRYVRSEVPLIEATFADVFGTARDK